MAEQRWTTNVTAASSRVTTGRVVSTAAPLVWGEARPYTANDYDQALANDEPSPLTTVRAPERSKPGPL